ncbi:MAG TPA: AAA family ATPase, partial [Polyangiales bacterium]|nr:AAA family ATPase [Polyangiales bacterium]
SIWEVLTAKLNGTLPAPLPEEAPRDLVQLSAALLARDPALRPTAAQIRERLASSGPAPARSSLLPRVADDEGAALLGRLGELGALREAYAKSRSGAALVVSIAGESGIGKSALCRAFLRELAREGHAVLLTGRCYEQENVPFKAIDPVIDELSRYLRRLRPEHAAALLPRDAFALARLFPVLARVRAFEEAPPRNVPDPRELQRLAFAAFGELLGRIRDRAPLVLFVDDLQWTDADSAKLLRHCLMSREPVPLLFVFSQRVDPGERALLQSVIEVARENPALEYHELALSPLTAADAELLAARWLGGAANDNTQAAIAQESGGNPFFAMELARFAQAGGADPSAAPSLAALLDARVRQLEPSARRLLQALALAGRPLSIDVVLDASGAQRADLDVLRDAHLVRGSESASGRSVECYHDRVRERVCVALTESERIELHRGLARALERQDEPELLSRCLEGAGEPRAAAEHAARAAAQASAALAFDRAADLYQRALQLSAASDDARRELLVHLGSALENTGRGAEAAAAYLHAARLSSGDEGLDLQRRAAEQLLHSGQLDRGMELLVPVCRALEIELPSGAGAALLSLGWSRLKLRLHALDRPAPASVSPRDALRLRALRTAVTGLTGYRPVHAASASALYLLCALPRGDAAHLVRALGFHAHSRGLIDPESPRVAEVLARTVELAERDGGPELIGFAALMQGTDAYHQEHCAEARAHLDRARKAFRECTGVEWELDSVNVYDQLSALYAGDYADIARTTPGWQDQAMRRRRVWAATMFTGFAGMPAWLVSDDVASYRAKLDEARALWRETSDPGWPGFLLLYAEALLSVYEGQPARGFDRMAQQHASAQRLVITRTLTGALGYATHRGRCAAAALGRGNVARGERPQLVAALRESIAVLKRKGLVRSAGMGSMLAAALAANQGRDDEMQSELRSAIAAFERAGAKMHLAAARRRLGQLLGGAEGAQLTAAGERFMREQGVRELEGMTELNCPGFRARV